jgi:hypothetical protein
MHLLLSNSRECVILRVMCGSVFALTKCVPDIVISLRTLRSIMLNADSSKCLSLFRI